MLDKKDQKRLIDFSENKSGIYIIINLLDGKRYIGSAKNLGKRKTGHLAKLRHGKHENRHLQRSFDKYGIDCFEFRILEDCEKDNCLLLEQKYLDEIFSSEENIKQYYNMNPYAIRPPIMCGKDNPNYGKDFSIETRLKMSLEKKETTKGKDNNFFGKKHSDETRAKMKKAHDVLPVYAKNVITQEECIFQNTKEAAEYIGINQTVVCRRLNQKSERYTNTLIKKEWKVTR